MLPVVLPVVLPVYSTLNALGLSTVLDEVDKCVFMTMHGIGF